MLPCFVAPGEALARPVAVLPAARYPGWLAAQPGALQGWLEATGFEPKPAATALLPAPDGGLAGALLILSEPVEPWDFAALRGRLPAGDWRLDWAGSPPETGKAALGWALASYRFERYRKRDAKAVRLALEDDPELRGSEAIAEAVWLARDLINTPASDLGPAELAEAVGAVAARFGAAFRTIEGDALLTENFPAIHAVGRASPRAPRLVELVWGDPDAPKVTLVGKGVCFDTGGLDLKPSQNMLHDEEGHGRRRGHARSRAGGHGAGRAGPPQAPDRRGREQRLRQRLPPGRRARDPQGPDGRDRQHRRRGPPRAGRPSGRGRPRGPRAR